MIIDRDHRFIDLARRQAFRSLYLPKRVGVLITRGTKILVEGFNKVSHPAHLKFPGIDGYTFYSLHAEMDALFRLSNPREARGTTVYIYGMKVRSHNAKPCPLCERYLRLYKVKRVVFTDEVGSVQELQFS